MHRFTCALLLLCTTTATAAPPDHPVVPGFERYFTEAKADAAQGGQLLLGALHCTSCHATEAAILKHQAPILDGVASRARVGHLRKFLRDPQSVKPGTTMPTLFAGDAERDQKVEALLHFLASNGTPRHEKPDLKGIAPGRDLYHKVGCVACHGTRDATGNADKVFSTSVPLGDLKAKYTLAGLSAFLTDPHQARPGGRMPRLLQANEPRQVANYLLQGIKVDLPTGKGASKYSYYEGSWSRVPDFSKLKPKAAGMAPGFDLSVARRGSDYAIRFEGYIKLDREGSYTFTLHSDDGSLLWIDGKQVVENDGIHPPQSRSGKATLTQGVHKVVVGFMQGGGGAELEVTIEGGNVGRTNLGELVADTVAALEKKPVVKRTPDEDLLEFKPGLIAEGRKLFASAGCASCHQLREGQKPIVSTLTATPLEKLKGDKGCLSATPANGLPSWKLSVTQRTVLTKAIATPPPLDKAPAAVIARTFTAFNCYACHSRDKVGGPEEALDKSFQTTQPEMGDEARVPPLLDGVGAKLTTEYLKQLLDRGGHDRLYMHTRMPGFGQANVGHLVEAFAALDRLPAVKPVTFAESPARVKSLGRHMIGNEAFGCIKCHTFNGIKAEGTQGIDMTLMPRRLKHEWFHAYITDPQKVRPGTRMPSAFLEGKSVLPKILDGTAPTQIEAMWTYLLEGNKARLPVGMQKQSIVLSPTTGAIIYRNFIQGSGNRAIAVGYPEKAHLAFDANEMHLSMLWQGAFLDAARHWVDRGAGSEGPLGDNVLTLHRGAPFAELESNDASWPSAAPKEQGYRFLGYRLTPDDRPTFLYSFAGINVEDFPTAQTGKDPFLKRTLVLTTDKKMDNLHFRAALGGKVESLKDGWYRVDGWKLKVEGGEPVVRQSGGKTELLVPIRFKDGKAQLTLEYAW